MTNLHTHTHLVTTSLPVLIVSGTSSVSRFTFKVYFCLEFDGDTITQMVTIRRPAQTGTGSQTGIESETGRDAGKQVLGPMRQVCDR